jgi:hypothetical protein
MRAALAALGPLATRGFPAARARGHSHRALLTAPTRRAPPNAGASSSSFARLRRLHLLSRASTMTRRERASAATTNVRRNNSQKTHVSSLSDPLPERVPAWSDRPTDRDALREHFRRVPFVLLITPVPARPRPRGSRRSSRTDFSRRALRSFLSAHNPSVVSIPTRRDAFRLLQLTPFNAIHPDVGSRGPSTLRCVLYTGSHTTALAW